MWKKNLNQGVLTTVTCIMPTTCANEKNNEVKVQTNETIISEKYIWHINRRHSFLVKTYLILYMIYSFILKNRFVVVVTSCTALLLYISEKKLNLIFIIYYLQYLHTILGKEKGALI